MWLPSAHWDTSLGVPPPLEQPPLIASAPRFSPTPGQAVPLGPRWPLVYTRPQTHPTSHFLLAEEPRAQPGHPSPLVSAIGMTWFTSSIPRHPPLLESPSSPGHRPHGQTLGAPPAPPTWTGRPGAAGWYPARRWMSHSSFGATAFWGLQHHCFGGYQCCCGSGAGCSPGRHRRHVPH